jgi:hypothetical protein
MKKLTLEDKFDKVKDHLIGVWRFREANRKIRWCATYEFNGYYYDVDGFENVADTLSSVHRNLQGLKRRNGGKTKTN